MTKAELIDQVWETNQHMTKRGVSDVIDAAFDLLSKGIKKDGRFTYPGFGTWSVRKHKARTGRNPRTGEEIKIKASKTVGFRPAPIFKDKL